MHVSPDVCIVYVCNRVGVHVRLIYIFYSIPIRVGGGGYCNAIIYHYFLNPGGYNRLFSVGPVCCKGVREKERKRVGFLLFALNRYENKSRTARRIGHGGYLTSAYAFTTSDYTCGI
jgi:hypothetical protein